MKVLRDYQWTSVERGKTQNLLIADDCGLGKTITAVSTALASVGQMHPFRVLVVCPKKVREQWVQEIQEVLGPEFERTYILEHGLSYNINDTWGFFIIHYDALPKALYLNNYVWDVIIADEAHRLRNRTNRWTKAIKRLTAARILALTATPMDRYPSELWSILDFLKVPRLYKFTDFKARYEKWFWVQGSEKTFPVYQGMRNEDELRTLLNTVIIKHSKEEVAPELPPNTIIKIPVEMEEQQAAAYEQIDKATDIIVPVEGINDLIIQNALVKMVRLQQVSTDPALLDIPAKSGKIEWVKEFLNDHANEKVVVFTKWRETALRLAHEVGVGTAYIVGGEKPMHVEAFKDGNMNVLVGTIAAMGIGLNLPMATHAVFLDMEWSTLQMQQAYDRIHRLGITEPKFTHLLISSKVDEYIYKAVQHKWSQIELITHFFQDSL